MNPKLFQPLQAGAIACANRVWMAPLTRLRSHEPADTCGPHAATYYAQRASAGLIVSEATHISPQAKGYGGAPGIYSAEQVASWQPVTRAVHEAGGRIVLQLWHVGRISHSSLQPAGLAPVAPSALPCEARTSIRDAQGQPQRVMCSPARALARSELPGLVDSYAMATRRAREAGFDGVEIHGANGYLLHQFLAAASNRRDDDYGGGIAQRMRLLLEVVDACCAAWSADRVGLRVSFCSNSADLADDAPEANALTVARALRERQLAFLHLSEPDWMGQGPGLTPAFRDALREAYGPGVIVGAGGYTAERAEAALQQGWLDAVAFGRPFIANPDLPERLRRGSALNAPEPARFYGGGAEGYTDYPVLSAA